LIRAWRPFHEGKPRKQSILGPGDRHPPAEIGDLQLRLFEYLLGAQAGRRQDAGERTGIDVVVLRRLAGAGGEGDDHALELAFGDEALGGILEALGEGDVAAGIDVLSRRSWRVSRAPTTPTWRNCASRS
jgi:hypothetical protein